MYKRYGLAWVQFSGCAFGIAFGGPILYRINCENNQVEQLDYDTETWKVVDKSQKAYNIGSDEAGALWIRNAKDQIMKWDVASESWKKMGLENANYIAAGPTGISERVYALAGEQERGTGDYTIYRYSGNKRWAKVPGTYASEITVANTGRLYIANSQARIFTANPFDDEKENEII